MIANNEVSALLSAEHWTWAKTMPGVPHEYIVRGRCHMTDARFEAVVRLQRETEMFHRCAETTMDKGVQGEITPFVSPSPMFQST